MYGLKIYNIFPGDGNLEWGIQAPISLIFSLANNRVFFIGSIMIGFLYTNYDHLGYDGATGNNFRGGDPQKGAGLGIYFAINEHANFQLGCNFISIPEVTPALDINQYDTQAVSLSAICSAPLSVSFHLRF